MYKGKFNYSIKLVSQKLPNGIAACLSFDISTCSLHYTFGPSNTTAEPNRVKLQSQFALIAKSNRVLQSRIVNSRAESSINCQALICAKNCV